MSKMFQVYGIGQALIPVLPPPLPFQSAPTSTQTNYEIGQLVYTPPNSPTAFYLYGGGGNWIELVTSAGDVLSVTGTANQILASPTTGAVVLSLIGPYTPATYTSHGVLIGRGTSSIVATATGSAGQILTSGGASADPTWTTATFPATVTAGDLLVATATNVIGGIADVATGQVLMSGGVGVIPAYSGSPSVSGSVTAGTGLTATTGNLTVSAGDANVTGNVVASKSAAGANVTVQATNSDNTNGASNAGVEIASGGASGGDPYLSFQISGVGASTMTMGLDNSASDTFVISNSAALGTNNAFTLTQAGALGATTSVTAGTTVTATLGDITATNGNLVLNTAGNKIVIATGSNASVGTSAAMSGTPGAVIVSTTACSATAKVFYSRATTGGTPGQVSITAQDGTGFTLTSTANETSTFNWWIINA